MPPRAWRIGFSHRSILSRAIPVPLSIAVLGLALVGVGCSDDDDDNSSSQTSNSITIKEDHEWSFDVNDYSWNSPGATAKVTLEIDDFHHGDMLLTIYDATGRIIFSKLYWTFDWYWYIDGEFTDIDFTDIGTPGQWTIVLEYSEFTGDVDLIVESTQSPPPEPVVPPPSSSSEILDSSFGKQGRATYEPGTTAARRIAIDSAGRILACGTIVDTDGSRHLTVWRYTASGALDANFGAGGLRSLDNSTYFATGALDIAVDGNDRPIVSGWVAPLADRRNDLAVYRFTTSGNIDTSFSSDGLATLDDGEDEAGLGVAVDTTGRVVVAGTSRNPDGTAGHLLVIRLLSSGIFDDTFNGNGIIRTTDATDRARDVAIASGDQPVVLGTRSDNLAIWKFTSGGTPDGTFGTGGVATSPGGTGEFRQGNSIAIKDDGTLGVAGVRFFSDGSSPPELALWRFLANGLPLGSFGGSGFLSYRYASGWAAGSGIRFDPQGRLIVSGTTKSVGGGSSDASATLWRYFSSGSIDTSLSGSGGTGVARFDPRPSNAGTSASSLVLLGNGKVLASGSAFSRDTNGVDLLIWRLIP